jgi:hypothetical protein
MPNDLVKFIELLYGVVVGFTFGEISKSKTFKDLVSGTIKPRDVIQNFSLLFALIIFIISDYTVYMWAADNNNNSEVLYYSNFGAVMFLLDVILLSVIYFLTIIASFQASPRRLHSFLMLFVLFHVIVTIWWVLYGLRSGKGAFSSIPKAHIIRASIYFTLLLLYRLAIWQNIGGFKKGFETDSLKYVDQKLFTVAIIIVSITIAVVSFDRFLDFHQRMFNK